MTSAALIDFVVSTAEIATGAPAQWAVAKSKMARMGKKGGRERSRCWSEEDDLYLDGNLGVKSLPEIGADLGRSVNALHVRMVRKKMAHPSKRPGYLTGNQVAKALGVDIHAVMMWKKLGLMPIEIVPGVRRIMRVQYEVVKRWAVNPENWIYYKLEKVRDEKIKRLVELRRQRWGDKWVTTGWIATRFGLASHKCVEEAIYRGKLPGKKWGNWFVKQSDAEARQWYAGKGNAKKKYNWSARANAFLLRMIEEGKSWAAIGRMMKISHESVRIQAMKLKGV